MDYLFYQLGHSASGIISIIVILIVIVIVMNRKSVNTISTPMTTLVLKEYNLAQSEEEFELVNIVGRTSGLISWIMSVIGIDNLTQMRINKKEFSIISSSLFGSSYTVFSISNIASAHCAFYRPFHNMVIAVILAIIGLFTMFSSFGVAIILFLIAAIFVYKFYFNKTIRIMVMTKGGGIFGMCFKPSLIENVDVNLDVAETTIDMINNTIIEMQTKE